MATAPKKNKIVWIEVHPSIEAATAAKTLMTTSRGFEKANITIQSGARVKLLAQSVSGATETNFEDPSDGELFVVTGVK